MQDISTLPGFIAGPVDWFSPDFGGHLHVGLEFGEVSA